MVEQRFTFNSIAADYDAHRPGYPQPLFDELLALTPGDGQVLEIGCGTGKATELLARSGRSLTALDPGPEMLIQARRRLGDPDTVRFVLGTFEDWPPDRGPFGLICAAQAWHWVDPDQGYAKAASLLSRDGILAIFGNVDQSLPEPLFGQIKQAFRAAFGREQSEGPSAAAYGADGWISQQFAVAGLFGPVQHRAYPHRVTYDAETYAAVVGTYSDVQMLAPEQRQTLLSEIEAAVRRLGSPLVVQLETHVHWAGRRAEPAGRTGANAD